MGLTAQDLRRLLGRRSRRSKYGNTPKRVDGIRFDSAKEAARWGELRLMERGGLIKDLWRQVRFPLVVNGQLICTYIADFVYSEGKLVVEDVKGHRTEIYRLKKKLMLACHGITIKET